MSDGDKAAIIKNTCNSDSDTRELDRVASFSDAVFAVAITLLVLNIDVPSVPDNMVGEKLVSEVLALWPHFLAFLLSFLIIGFLWISHHTLFKYIKKQNHTLLWINLAVLLGIVLLPFSTNMVSEYGNTEIGVIIYAANWFAECLLFALIWYYVSKSGRLVSNDFDIGLGMHAARSFLFVGLIFLLSIGIAFINVSTAQYFWFMIIPVNILNERIEKKRRASRSPD